MKNYLLPGDAPNTWKFNTDYVVDKLGDDSHFMDPDSPKEFVLYINSAESSSIRSELITKLGSYANEVPYTYKKEGQLITGTVSINIIAVNM